MAATGTRTVIARRWGNGGSAMRSDCDEKVAITQENLPHSRLRTGWHCGLAFCSLFTI
jgi:hypothetical protein